MKNTCAPPQMFVSDGLRACHFLHFLKVATYFYTYFYHKIKKSSKPCDYKLLPQTYHVFTTISFSFALFLRDYFEAITSCSRFFGIPFLNFFLIADVPVLLTYQSNHIHSYLYVSIIQSALNNHNGTKTEHKMK